jgi:hypothetical protein
VKELEEQAGVLNGDGADAKPTTGSCVDVILQKIVQPFPCKMVSFISGHGDNCGNAQVITGKKRESIRSSKCRPP